MLAARGLGSGSALGEIVATSAHFDVLVYAGKRVIGSGATAVTLVPAMAETAAHVTRLQRSPTYVVTRPGHDRIANWMNRRLPAGLAYGLSRWKYVLLGSFFYTLAKRRPRLVKNLIVKAARDQLGADYDVSTHFTPRYNPWDERLCVVPDGDLFRAIKSGRASVVTDHIETFTEKGMMYSDVPNLASCLGYTNASWTLKADLTCGHICRLLNHMESQGFTKATPRLRDPDMGTLPSLDFTSGYIQRGIARLPKQGTRAPWRLYQNYALDIMSLRYGAVDNDAMEWR